jgi:hypothetical protein
MGQLLSAENVSVASRVVAPVSFMAWRGALQGMHLSQVASQFTEDWLGALLSPDVAVSGIGRVEVDVDSFKNNVDAEVLDLSGVSIGLMPSSSASSDFHDNFALGNNIPGKMERFLARYHNQTFAAFAVGAVLLLWMI